MNVTITVSIEGYAGHVERHSTLILPDDPLGYDVQGICQQGASLVKMALSHYENQVEEEKECQ